MKERDRRYDLTLKFHRMEIGDGIEEVRIRNESYLNSLREFLHPNRSIFYNSDYDF